MGVSRDLPKVFGYPLLSQERVKLRTSNFVGTFIGLIRTKAHENVGNSAVGIVRESQGVSKIFRAPICRAHCAVIFAIAQLSCVLKPAHANPLDAEPKTAQIGHTRSLKVIYFDVTEKLLRDCNSCGLVCESLEDTVSERNENRHFNDLTDARFRAKA